MAEALDREAPSNRGDWLAVPLKTRQAVAEMLVVHVAGGAPSPALSAAVGFLAAALFEGLAAIRSRALAEPRRASGSDVGNRQSVEQNQRDAAAVEADGRGRHAVVRPPIGPAFSFGTGPTTRSSAGRPWASSRASCAFPTTRASSARWFTPASLVAPAAISPDSEINRQVDRQLGYQTRTLVCVPLRGSQGELFGAFEVINKLDGQFTTDDELALAELASHAAVALENTQQFAELLSTHRHIVEQAAEGVQLIGRKPGHRRPALGHSPRGRHRAGDVDPGRERHGQGGRRPVDPLSQPPRASSPSSP